MFYLWKDLYYIIRYSSQTVLFILKFYVHMFDQKHFCVDVDLENKKIFCYHIKILNRKIEERKGFSLIRPFVYLL